MFSPELTLFVIITAILAGVCTAAIGPGGIFLTIIFYTILSLSTAKVAATASAMFVVTGAVGTIAYYRSGDFDFAGAREVMILMSVTAILGAPVGTRLNLLLPEYVFAWLLMSIVVVVGVLILYRTLYGLEPSYRIMAAPSSQRRVLLSLIGFNIGLLGSMLGIGGPVIAVPILIILGMPMLISLAVAQLQSVFVSGFATISYATVGTISIPVALLAGIPQIVGILVGWRIAHYVDERHLKLILAIILVIIAPTIVL